MQLRRYEKNPILSPNPANRWEAMVRTNPGVWYDAASGKITMLYRAAGEDADHYTYFGLAESTDGFHFEPQGSEPIVSPTEDGFDAGCMEDARIIKVGEWYYITYATRAFPPGRYWVANAEGRSPRPPMPVEFPHSFRHNITATGLLMTRDFRKFYRAGRITDPTLDDRDVYLFPERVNGSWVLIHRPYDWVGDAFGTSAPAIWINTSPDVLKWDFTKSRLLLKGQYDWELKVGGNAPPLRTPDGWLMLYHAVGPDRYYRFGAVLLDLEDPSVVLCRTRKPIYEPVEKYETEGFYAGGGVVFSCANVVIGDTLFVYYGGADKHCCVATCALQELIEHVKGQPI